MATSNYNQAISEANKEHHLSPSNPWAKPETHFYSLRAIAHNLQITIRIAQNRHHQPQLQPSHSSPPNNPPPPPWNPVQALPPEAQEMSFYSNVVRTPWLRDLTLTPKKRKRNLTEVNTVSYHRVFGSCVTIVNHVIIMFLGLVLLL